MGKLENCEKFEKFFKELVKTKNQNYSEIENDLNIRVFFLNTNIEFIQKDFSNILCSILKNSFNYYSTYFQAYIFSNPNYNEVSKVLFEIGEIKKNEINKNYLVLQTLLRELEIYSLKRESDKILEKFDYFYKKVKELSKFILEIFELEIENLKKSKIKIEKINFQNSSVFI